VSRPPAFSVLEMCAAPGFVARLDPEAQEIMKVSRDADKADRNVGGED